MATDLPTIMNYSNASSSLNLGAYQPGTATGGIVSKAWNPFASNESHAQDFAHQVNAFMSEIQPKKEKPMADKTGKRIVQVFIVDTNDNLSLENALIFGGDQKFTDATDQELFFEVEIVKLLEDHNKRRAQTLDKKATKASGKDVFLEPAKIRDLKMVISTLAEF